MPKKLSNPKTGAAFIRVPADDRGRAFIAQLRTFANRAHAYRFRARARGSRVAAAAALGIHRRAFDQDLPSAYARYFDVYMDGAPDVSQLTWQVRQLTRERDNLKNTAQALADMRGRCDAISTAECLCRVNLDAMTAERDKLRAALERESARVKLYRATYRRAHDLRMATAAAHAEQRERDLNELRALREQLALPLWRIAAARVTLAFWRVLGRA